MSVIVLLGLASPARATDWFGTDLGGANLLLADGDRISGTFTNVGELRVPGGARVSVDEVRIEARRVVVAGELVADERGRPGGSGAGVGPCVGWAPALGDGGAGGGGYGGAGGAGGAYVYDVPGFGGATCGDLLLGDPEAGSDGGTGIADTSGAGGVGGGLVDLVALDEIDVSITGRITADGGPGFEGYEEHGGSPYPLLGGGGGGGSGGAIRLVAPVLHLEGVLSARGGEGGPGGQSCCYGGGGGGGGGRIAITGGRLGSPQVDVSGGTGGVDNVGLVAEDGQDGTWSESPWSGEPPEENADRDLDGVPDGIDRCDGNDATDDADADGFCTADVLGRTMDCDDTDASSFPGAPELCDGRDNACVGRPPTDEADLDGDGTSICAGDCDDLDPVDACAASSSGGCAVGGSLGSFAALLLVGALFRSRSEPIPRAG